MILEQDRQDNILDILEQNHYPFQQYRFYKQDGKRKILGVGGFSTIYDMVDCECEEKHYAMKVMGFSNLTVSNAKFMEQFRIQRMESQHVVRPITARIIKLTFEENTNRVNLEVVENDTEKWEEEGIFLQFLLMEKLDPILSRDRFKNAILKNTKLSEEKEILRFALQIGSVLQMTHEQSVLHRDIKLENIFWDSKSSNYKLGDFGIAKYLENGNAETIVFSDGYGAPEIQNRLHDNYNVTADIYSFGVTLYLLLNDLTFPGSTGYYSNPVQYSSDYIFPAPKNASVEMTRIIRRMCCYNWTERYQSMSDLMRDLNHLNDTRECLKKKEENKLLEEYLTETYQEEKIELTETYQEEEQEKQDYKITEGYVESLRNRIEEKKQIKKKEAIYERNMLVDSFKFMLLFVLLLVSCRTEQNMILDWRFWILPFLVFVEGILTEIKEFQILFGIGVLVLGIYICINQEFFIPYIVLLLGMLYGSASAMLGGGFGFFTWMLLIRYDYIHYFDFAEKYNILCMIMIYIFYLISKNITVQKEAKKSNIFISDIRYIAFKLMLYFLMIIGFGCSIFQFIGVIEIPFMIQRLHLFWTGILTLIIWEVLEEPIEEEENDRNMDIRRD